MKNVLTEEGDCVQNYFQSLPGVKECPADQNPASYMLEIIGAGIGHVAQRDFALDYQQSSLAQRNRMLEYSSICFAFLTYKKKFI